MKKKRNKYAAIISCCVLAAVFAVGFSVSTAEKEAEENRIVQIEEENETAQVNLNKNAAPKTEIIKENKTPETDVKEVPENETPAVQPEIPQSGDGYSEAEDVGEFENALVFAVPVMGNVAMDYSMDKMVYDPTLEQYRTSDSICYSAEEGTRVSSAAQGTVESVLKDSSKGVSVTVFHGDGWRTTYSQLSENVAVSQGDIIEKGQTIGYVGTPGRYSSAMGSHLEFKMTLNGESIDPKTALAE